MPTATASKPKRQTTTKPTRPGLTITPEQLAEAEAADMDARDAATALRSLATIRVGQVQWSDYSSTGITGAEIERLLARQWGGNGRSDGATFAHIDQGRACVWFGGEPDDGTPPDLTGSDLYAAIRTVMNLTEPADPFGELKATGKSRAKPASSPHAPREEASAASEAGRSSANASKPEAQAKKTPHPNPLPSQARGEGTGKAVSAADLMAGVEVIDERDMLYDEIHRSAGNPRQSFDETLIAEMAPNIVTICQLNPLTIREGSGELIDGETRHRAGGVAKAKSLRCKVVRCTDAQAACIRLMTSLQRRDLNAIERARAIVALQQQHGLSQRQMLELLDLKSQGAISNITRLLDLPEIWQQRVMSGEITPTAARELVPWVTEPAVLTAVETSLERCAKDDWSTSLGRLIDMAVRQGSRPLKDDYYYDGHRSRKVAINATPDQREALRVRKVDREERAFDIPLWNELQAADEQARATKEAKRADKGAAAGKVDPAKARENAKKQADQLAKRLYRFKVAWLQAQCLREIETARPEIVLGLALLLTTREGLHGRHNLLEEDLRMRDSSRSPARLLQALTKRSLAQHVGNALQLVRADLADRFDGYHSVFTPEMIEALAVTLGIDLKRAWPASFDEDAACSHLWDVFVGLWSKDQIIDLLDEWKIKTPEIADRTKAKRSDLIEYLVASKPCPKALLEAKAVRLT